MIMGEKRVYKPRKPGGGRKKLRPEYDAGKNLKEQMESVVALYDSEMSLQAIGEELGLNPIKVRKLLYLQEFRSMEHFKLELIEYLDYYNNRRIKAKRKGLPPAIHRQQALSAA